MPRATATQVSACAVLRHGLACRMDYAEMLPMDLPVTYVAPAPIPLGNRLRVPDSVYKVMEIPCIQCASQLIEQQITLKAVAACLFADPIIAGAAMLTR